MSRAARLVLSLLAIGCATSAPAPVARPRAPRAAERPPPSDATERLQARLDESSVRREATPPIRGGTLLITSDGRRAAVSEPSRDFVWIADLTSAPPRIEDRFELEPGDEPGRLVEADDGTIYVALRGSGAVMHLDPDRRAPTARWPVCPAPRGLAVDGDALIVACAGGDLVTLSAHDGERREVRRLTPDLRDVGTDANGLWVSRFRSAQWLRVRAGAAEPHALETAELPAPFVRDNDPVAPFAAKVAWRTFADPDGLVMIHQRHYLGDLDSELFGTDAYYGNGVVRTGISRWEDDQLVWTHAFDGVLPVDAARMDDGRYAIALAGSDRVMLFDPEGQRTRWMGVVQGRRPTAVAYHPEVGLVVQLRDEPSLMIYSNVEAYGGVQVNLGDYLFYRRSTGDEVFHRAVRSVACASCHPEGGDDGHVWRLDSQPRRTQPLRGGLVGRGAFHWSGDLPSFGALMNATWVRRMGAPALATDQVDRVAHWIDAIADPPRPRIVDSEAVARGRALFEDPEVDCARCHAGPRGTDHRAHDVGTGGAFVTPALVGLSRRAPYLHDGRAATIEERLGRHHTRGHGRLRHLTGAQRADLAAYLRSL